MSLSVQAEADVNVSFLIEEYTKYGCMYVCGCSEKGELHERAKQSEKVDCLSETCPRFALNRLS